MARLTPEQERVLQRQGADQRASLRMSELARVRQILFDIVGADAAQAIEDLIDAKILRGQ